MGYTEGRRQKAEGRLAAAEGICLPSAFRLPPSSRRSSGFTMIELLTVISIIVFLLSVLSAVLLKSAQAARNKAAHSIIQKVAIGLTRYQADFRTLPPDSGFGLPTNGGIVNGKVLYDAATLWRYLGQELSANNRSYGPYATFSENELVPFIDSQGKNVFIVVDPWKTPLGFVGDPDRVVHNRDTFDLFSAGPDRKTACNDQLDNEGDGAADNSNDAYTGSGLATSQQMGEAALNGCLTAFRKNPKPGETLDDINNWDPQD
jgi:prepilin-type N-terminal cleavage/methylation domain-containing protein